jgi:hypothetical protein
MKYEMKGANRAGVLSFAVRSAGFSLWALTGRTGGSAFHNSSFILGRCRGAGGFLAVTPLHLLRVISSSDFALADTNPISLHERLSRSSATASPMASGSSVYPAGTWKKTRLRV